jgi:hypothetical protein
MNRIITRMLIVFIGLVATFISAHLYQMLPVNQRAPILMGSVLALTVLGGIVFLFHPKVSRRTKFQSLSVSFGFFLALFLAEAMAWVYFASDENAASMRAILCGDSQQPLGDELARAQPYLMYVSAPGYKDDTNYHNEQGYRGRAVPMKRTPRVTRILCLGGSTTYSIGTDDADQSYPAQLEAILNRQLPPGIDGIEVINGGLNYGTTAELLTHYHFKFHYFRPDLIIINTGGNDALAAGAPYYQPDYSHWRKSFQVQRPLSPVGQTIVKSRLASLIVIDFLYGSWGKTIGLIDRPPGKPLTVWHEAARNGDSAESLTDEELGFTHNLNTLIDMIERDGGKVLLVPFRINPRDPRGEALVQCARNERILKDIAKTRGLQLAPFPHGVVSAENWVDSCHLNPPGCSQKAIHIASFVHNVLWADE